MGKVIRDFSKLSKILQEEVYELFQEGELERTVFPFKGTLQEGVIFQYEEDTFLIPKSTIISGRTGSSDDLEDEDDEDVDTEELTEDLDEE